MHPLSRPPSVNKAPTFLLSEEKAARLGNLGAFLKQTHNFSGFGKASQLQFGVNEILTYLDFKRASISFDEGEFQTQRFF